MRKTPAWLQRRRTPLHRARAKRRRGACGVLAGEPGGLVWRSFQNPTEESEYAMMNFSLAIGPLIALIAGILILIVPRLLNYIVAIYLIIIGLLGLFGSGSFRLHG